MGLSTPFDYRTAMPQRVLATFVTTTTYGSWLPGDARGFVENGRILPPDSVRLRRANSLMKKAPVILSEAEQTAAFRALSAACDEFSYQLTDCTIECRHLHWIVGHGFDAVPAMVGRLKTRMRQALTRGRIWTDGYCHRCLYTPKEIETARGYVARHAGCRMSNGHVRFPETTLPPTRSIPQSPNPPAKPGADGSVGGRHTGRV